MPTHPTEQFATLRPDLAETLVEFDLQADQMGFVGLRIAPAMEVARKLGQFPRIPLKELLKQRNTERSPDGRYNSGEGKATKDFYSCTEHGLEERVDETEAEMYREWWDAEQLAADRCRDAVIRNHNARVIAAALGIAHTTPAGTAWTNLSGSSPIANIRTAKLAVRARTGAVPNVLVIDYERWEMLKDNEEILERVKYSGHTNPNRGAMTKAAVAQALDLEEIVVSGSLTNEANEVQAAELASMWDPSEALLFVRATGNNLRRPHFMRTFHWGADGSRIGGLVESYDDRTRRSEIVRCRMDTDEKILYEACAERITGI